MVVELEERRKILNSIREYLDRCGIPGYTFHYDDNIEAWVVGCYVAGTTLTEARRNIFNHL